MTTPTSHPILLPDDERWDSARAAWNLAVDQQPAAVALPESAEDVVAAVRWAVERDLRVTAQALGHGSASLEPLDGTLLIKTAGLSEVGVDPDARVDRIGAGVLASDVAAAAGEHGLAAPLGSSHDVSVVGYTLGGGFGWLGRKHGLASSNVVAIEAVTADGTLVRADAGSEPDLFWALRGGGGSFAVVTALELALQPIAEVAAGILWWPIERGDEVLHAWREVAESGLPDEITTVGRYLQYPPLDFIPEPVRGKSFAVVEAFGLGDPGELDEALAPLRALTPANDTVAAMPAARLSEVHMDPPGPTPGYGDGLMLAGLPPEAIDALVGVAGAGSGSPMLSVEVRQLGGELGRARPENGALQAIDAAYGLWAVAPAPTPEAQAPIAAHITRIQEALAPFAAERGAMNFSGVARDAASFFSRGDYDRLRRIKASVDPDDRIRSNQPIPPAG